METILTSVLLLDIRSLSSHFLLPNYLFDCFKIFKDKHDKFDVSEVNLPVDAKPLKMSCNIT